MKDVWKYAGFGLLLVSMGVAGQVRAQTTLTATPTQIQANTVYQYDGTTFDFTSCSVSCGALAIEAVPNSSGAEIEIVGDPPASNIYSGTAGGAQLGQNLGLTVGEGVGRYHGISSIQNIVQANLSAPGDATHDGSLVFATMTSFSNALTNVNGSPATSNYNTPTSMVTFNKTSSSFSFSIQLGDSTGSGTAGDTLTLTNVALLFSPAPEPASIALFATGLMGLTAVRRRFSRRSKQ